MNDSSLHYNICKILDQKMFFSLSLQIFLGQEWKEGTKKIHRVREFKKGVQHDSIDTRGTLCRFTYQYTLQYCYFLYDKLICSNYSPPKKGENNPPIAHVNLSAFLRSYLHWYLYWVSPLDILEFQITISLSQSCIRQPYEEWLQKWLSKKIAR